MEFFDSFLKGMLTTSMVEWLAVLSGILYVIFAARKQMICWLFALISSFLYVYLCFANQLYIETALQLFYVIMAVYGWVSWKSTHHLRLDIKKWRLSQHLLNIVLSGIASFLLGYVFQKYTDQANPYIDAFTTCYSLAATYMVTKKVLENWLYWIIIDLFSVYLYSSRELYLSSVLYMLFTLLALIGFFAWRKQYKSQRA